MTTSTSVPATPARMEALARMVSVTTPAPARPDTLARTAARQSTSVFTTHVIMVVLVMKGTTAMYVHAFLDMEDITASSCSPSILKDSQL